MQALIGTTIGLEVEYKGEVNRVSEALAEGGWCNSRQCGYHCACEFCNFTTGLLWRHQRDSTVDGEFITKIIADWATLRLAVDTLECAVTEVNEDLDLYYKIRADLNTGVHVHVRWSRSNWPYIVRAYLLYERYIQRIGSGPFADKREGMNLTALAALREQNYSPPGTMVDLADAASCVIDQISSDRHVDLNWSASNQTVEFRVFNSTTEAWQMELAARTAVAFCKAATFLPGMSSSFRMPGRALQTLQPPCSFADFRALICQFDDELGDLIDRQAALYPDRDMAAGPVDDAPDIEPEPTLAEPIDWVALDDEDDEEAARAERVHPRIHYNSPFAVDDWRIVVGPNGRIDGFISPAPEPVRMSDPDAEPEPCPCGCGQMLR